MTTPQTTDTANETPAELTAFLHSAGTDWDDLRYIVEDTLAIYYDETHGTEPAEDDDDQFSYEAVRWASDTADKYLVELNPSKDV